MRDDKEKSHVRLSLIDMFRVQVVLLGVTFHNSEIMVQQVGE